MPIASRGFVPRPRKAHDKRFSLSRNFGSPKVTLPERFSVKEAKGDINGQRNQFWNFCTACTSSEIGADEWGIPMSQKFQAMAISRIIGQSLDREGASIDAMMKAGRKYGFLPLSEEPANIRKSTSEKYICDPANWPADVFVKALKYQIVGGDFVVDGPHDPFDNTCTALLAHKPDNGISVGMPWYQSFQMSAGGIVRETFGEYTWHDVYAEGWEPIKGEPRIRLRSWDEGLGRDSYFLFTREQFNRLMRFPGSIAKIYMNADETLVEDLKERKLAISEQILNLYYEILFRMGKLLKK